jgi:hypothetical protein
MGTSFTAALLAVVHPMAREPADLSDDLIALVTARFVRPDDGAADAWSWCQVHTSWHDAHNAQLWSSQCAGNSMASQRGSPNFMHLVLMISCTRLRQLYCHVLAITFRV